MADVPSRLSSGDIYYRGGYIPMEEYRNMIYSRNLYSLENEYESTQLFSPKNQSGVAQSISTVLNVIPQYNRMQVNTNLAGNIYDAFRDNGSPLARIGLIMLGKHMAYNSAMNLSVKYLPSVDLSQVLKGNPNKIFKFNQDNSITVKNREDRTFMDRVGNFGSNFLGIDTYDVFGNANPFSKNPTNIDYIRNTGEAQLTRFFNAINLNLYKQYNTLRNNQLSDVYDEYSNKVGVSLDLSRDKTINRKYFSFNENPYWNSTLNTDAINLANENMIASFSAYGENVQEYAPSKTFVEFVFGDVVKPKGIYDIENFVNEESNFTEDNSSEKLVWGRDGVDGYAESKLKNLRSTDDEVESQEISDFKISGGLLEYTRNLLNASEGQFVDITRKAFKNGKGEIVGFQGSPLWRGNDSTYSRASETAGKTGVRQHTIIDPYDKFAKAIRFKGNIVYNGNNNGNQNSVIYKSVLPRIHPTMDKNGGINNKNLMFSIENLAIGTIKRDKFGVIDDEYGTPIPLSEVGPFAGRIMWFPPYNLEINEVAAAKYESTVMVGRNEPMYNYMNSERSAVLSFSLLIDYPEQLRNLNLKGDNKNKAIADFFAFGGDPIPDDYQIEVIEEKIEKLKEQIPEIEGPIEQAEVADPKVEPVEIYFPNDMPTSTQVNDIINTMYQSSDNGGLHYEITEGLESAQDGNGFGLNEEIYFITGLTKITEKTWSQPEFFVDQYTSIGENDQLGVSLLNKNLWDVYRNEDTRKYYNIRITGGASKLYLSENEKAYNEALGDRRIEATVKLIQDKLTAMFGKTVADEIIENNVDIIKSAGSAGSGEAGAEPENMHLEEVKRERRSTIEFKRNTVPVDNKEQKKTPKQQEDIGKIKQDIETLERQRESIKVKIAENIFEERNKAILNSFESISGNQYYPTFHSQTPEDFHRRLTFLQQCTRQGAAKRYDIKDEDGNLRARNSVFGKQPICILRVADFFYTKVVIESVTIDYADTTWDMNPEGFGMQPMIANVTLQMKLIGGQSLKGPIDALQNAVSFNYYANSTFTDKGMYGRASKEATKQDQYMFGVDGSGGIVGDKTNKLNAAYDVLTNKVTEGDK